MPRRAGGIRSSTASTTRRASSTACSASHVQADRCHSRLPLTLIPTYPDLPMEDVYPRVPRTDTRELYLRDLGRSRVVYIPWDIDRTFWDVMSRRSRTTAARTRSRWAHERAAAGRGRPAPGVLDVTVWRQRDSMTVHLVNLTNPMMMKGPLREIIPVGPQRVRVRLPRGLQPKRVQLLTAGTRLAWRSSNGVV